VFILADDLGYGDVGCYGATRIKTPRMDRLAREGARFTDGHAVAAVCNPSRYSILSGTYLWHAKRKNDYSLYFHEGQVTLPGLLKSAGYRTAALGKWHNGFGRGPEPDWNGELKPGPLEIGFDYFFGTPRTHNEPPFVFVENHRILGLDPADPIRMVPHAQVVQRGIKDWGWGISEGAHAAHAARPDDRIDFILAEKAAAFFARQTPDTPFFLYLAFAAPHVPIDPAPEFRGKSQVGLYGDYVEQLDYCLGLVLDALEKHGFAENTLVIFTSDNGAVFTRDAIKARHRCNGVLLGQKTDAWEGGHRVPLITRWPGHVPAGSERKALFSQVDIMATLAEAAGVRLPAGASPDGASDLAAFVDPASAPTKRTEALFLGTGGFALRQGDWVYLPKQGSGGMTVQVPSGPRWGLPYALLDMINSDVDPEGTVKPGAPREQLYDLGNDLPQSTNFAVREPSRAAAMKKRMQELVPQALRAPGPKPRPATKP
jgi:arylsulfatase A-like enzyme